MLFAAVDAVLPARALLFCREPAPSATAEYGHLSDASGDRSLRMEKHRHSSSNSQHGTTTLEIVFTFHRCTHMKETAFTSGACSKMPRSRVSR